MRIEPSEEAMYQRMDQKDRMLLLIPACGIVMFLGLILLSVGYPWIFCMAVIAAAFAGMSVSGAVYWRTKRLIMPVSGCFLELEGVYFSVCQPYLDGKYETCRILLEEVERLVKEQEGGFYLQVCQKKKSTIQEGGGGQRHILYVNPAGYTREDMEAVYQRIKARLPEAAEVYEYEK